MIQERRSVMLLFNCLALEMLGKWRKKTRLLRPILTISKLNLSDLSNDCEEFHDSKQIKV